MGFQRTAAAYSVTAGSGPTKAVLTVLAWHACDACGLAWPGVRAIVAESEVGETRVRAALSELVRGGLVAVHRYPNGGRGLATEYVVLPGLGELSTAPCGECGKRLKTPRVATPLGRNPSQGDAFTGQATVKGVTDHAETHQTGTDQQSLNKQQSGSLPLAVGVPPSGRDDRTLDTPPRVEIPDYALEALRRLGIAPPDSEPRL